jgi:NADH-quinone oxidoreductase subunit G
MPRLPPCAVLDACPGATVSPALRRGSVVGALQLGLPRRRRSRRCHPVPPPTASRPARAARRRSVARRPRWRPRPPALAGAAVIAVDVLTDSAAADVVLAAAAYGEKAGSTTNLEGRVTTVGQKVSVAGTAGTG